MTEGRILTLDADGVSVIDVSAAGLFSCFFLGGSGGAGGGGGSVGVGTLAPIITGTKME